MKIKWKTKEFRQKLDSEIDIALEKIGRIVYDKAYSDVVMDTGALRDSLRTEVDNVEKKVYVGSDLNYSVFVELGTRKMSPQSYLRPALYSSDKEIEATLTNLM